MMCCLNKIDIFEVNLVYLIIFGIISLEKCKQLVFDSDYIRNLLEQHKKIAGNPYLEYYYNEKKETTSIQTESDKLLILTCTPSLIVKKDKVPVISDKETPEYRSY